MRYPAQSPEQVFAIGCQGQRLAKVRLVEHRLELIVSQDAPQFEPDALYIVPL
jgi:hypothetical protein